MPDSYEVRKGDTLSDIGKGYGVDWNEIAKVNRIKNPNKIYPGQILTIPTKAQPAPPAPEPKPVVPVKEIGRTDPYENAIDVEVVPASQPSKKTEASTSTGSGPTAEAWGPGHSKSYPALTGEPGSSERLQSMYEQMKYGDFWLDWLDQALPTAVQGAGPGAANALLRAAGGLRKMANEYEWHKLPSADDPMAKWLFKNMKYFERTRDPNYKKPDAMSETRLDSFVRKVDDEGPGFSDFMDSILKRTFEFDTAASDALAHETATVPASTQNVMRLKQNELMIDAVDRTRTTVVPKNSTTVSKQ